MSIATNGECACGGAIYVNGDGDLICQGECGEILTRDEIDEAFEDLADMDEDEDEYEDYEYDGQPTEYEEWQDYMGGDDWDHGQYDEY